MKKTIIIYGSTTGTCQDLAERIANKLGVSDVVSMSDLDEAKIEAYDNLLLGTSTWGAGEMQDEWYDGVKTLKKANISGKTIALFGCGVSACYGDTFCGGLGELYNELKDCGAKFVGSVSTEDYDYSDSEAVKDGKFVGLVLDEVNEPDKTDSRIDAWVDVILPEL